MATEKTFNVLLIGAASDDMRRIQQHLSANARYAVRSHFTDEINAGGTAPLAERAPDVVVVSLDDNWETVLRSLPMARSAGTVLVVVGPADNMAAMRVAMQCGARDYFSHPVAAEDIDTCFLRIIRERSVPAAAVQGRHITTVINAAGGSGASFIAENVAHIMAKHHLLHVALIDLDYQFGCQALNLDVALQHGLTEVLAMLESLDTTTLQAHFSRHRSGLHILGEKLDDVVLPDDVAPADVKKLLELAAQTFDHVVIDLPRRIDALFAAVAEQSQRFVLVAQQTLPHVRDTKRLLTVLQREFEVATEDVVVVLNRYDDQHAITVADIEQTIGHGPVLVLPNDYQRAVAATAVAKPFIDCAPTSTLAKGLCQIAADLCGAQTTSEAEDKEPFYRRALGAVLGTLKR